MHVSDECKGNSVWMAQTRHLQLGEVAFPFPLPVQPLVKDLGWVHQVILQSQIWTPECVWGKTVDVLPSNAELWELSCASNSWQEQLQPHCRLSQLGEQNPQGCGVLLHKVYGREGGCLWGKKRDGWLPVDDFIILIFPPKYFKIIGLHELTWVWNELIKWEAESQMLLFSTIAMKSDCAYGSQWSCSYFQTASVEGSKESPVIISHHLPGFFTDLVRGEILCLPFPPPSRWAGEVLGILPSWGELELCLYISN